MERIKSKRLPKQENCWSFLSEGGELILMKSTFYLPLKDAAILRKSAEFFDDPDPCDIHRNAVMSRLYFELEDTASNLPKREKLSISKLPGNVLEYIELPEPAHFVLIS